MNELLIMVARAKLKKQWSYRPNHLNNEQLLVCAGGKEEGSVKTDARKKGYG